MFRRMTHKRLVPYAAGTVLAATPALALGPDTNTDGVVDDRDMVAVIESLGLLADTESAALADVDGDGRITGDDLVGVIMAYGQTEHPSKKVLRKKSTRKKITQHSVTRKKAPYRKKTTRKKKTRKHVRGS